MKKLALFLTIFLGVCAISFSQTLDWAVNFDNAGSQTQNGQCLVTSLVADDLGCTYAVGWFADTVDFDPGPGTHILFAENRYTMFIEKLNPNGELLWIHSIGDSGMQSATKIEFAANGNLLISGDFARGVVDFNPGPGIDTLRPIAAGGTQDYFLMEMDTAGNFVWVKRTSFPAEFLEASQSGAIYMGGTVDSGFWGPQDLDPGPGVVTVRTMHGIHETMVLVKYDSAGNYLWHRHFEGNPIPSNGWSGVSAGLGMAFDHQGNLVFTGYFGKNMDFDPGPGIDMHLATGGKDVFILKLDTAGDFIWAHSFGGTGDDIGRQVKANRNGNLYLAGEFHGTVDFDPGPSTLNVAAQGTSAEDVFLSKFDNSGNFSWVKKFGSASNDLVTSLEKDSLDNLFLAGTFIGTVDFDPNPGVYQATSTGGRNPYIVQLDSAGRFGGLSVFDGLSVINKICGLAVLDNGAIYSGGKFGLTVDFDPGPLSQSLVSNFHFGSGFITKFNPCPPIYVIETITSCDSFVWRNNVTYSSSIADVGFYPPSPSCDSIYLLDLTILPSSFRTDTVAACSSFTWIDGNTYFNSNNTARITFSNAAGCDSVVQLNLTIGLPDSTVEPVQACSSFTWIDGNTYYSNNNTASTILSSSTGCDSTVFLDLSISFPDTSVESVTACGSYTWIDGNTYYASDSTASVILTNRGGCDSLVYLNLTINPLTASTDTVSACSSFTWIDGNTYFTSNNTATDTLQNVMGCDSVIHLDLTILNAVTPTLGPDTFLCAPYAPIPLSVSGYAQQIWSTGDTDSLISVFQPGLYQVTVTDSNGCTGRDSIRIQHHPDNGSPFSLDSLFNCPQDSAPITTNTPWTPTVWSTGETTDTIWIDQPGTYWVDASDPNGCTMLDSIAVDWHQVNPAQFSWTANGLQVSFLNNTLGAVSSSWLFGTGASSIQSNPIYTYPAPGTYIVLLRTTDANQCEAEVQDTITVTAVGIEEELGLNWSVYPSPSAGVFAVKNTTSHSSQAEISVCDYLGKEVFYAENVWLGANENFSIDLSRNAEGVYLVRVTTAGKSFVKKVEIAR